MSTIGLMYLAESSQLPVELLAVVLGALSIVCAMAAIGYVVDKIKKENDE